MFEDPSRICIWVIVCNCRLRASKTPVLNTRIAVLKIRFKSITAQSLLVKKLSASGKKFFPIILISVILTIAVCIVVGSTIGISQESNMQPNGPVSTEKQAVGIALSLAQEYIQNSDQHKDYSIVTTKAVFEEVDRSYWFVEIGFKVERDECRCIPASGYAVAVWADTGETDHHGPIYHNGSKDVAGTFKVSVDRANEIAWPLVQAYAQENNRAITTLNNGCILDNRPYYDVVAQFEAIENVKGETLGNQKGVGGYYVSVWADTGEIRSHNVLNTAGF
jgi:hypothetical protein